MKNPGSIVLIRENFTVLLVLCFLVTNSSIAQSQIDLNPNGVILPSLSSSEIQAIEQPINGQLIYNESSRHMQLFNVGWLTIDESRQIIDSDGDTKVLVRESSHDYIQFQTDNIERFRLVGNLAGDTRLEWYGDNENILIGDSSGISLSGGTLNTFIGSKSGLRNLGSGNTFLGAKAGYSNTDGAFNTFLGYRAGEDADTGSSNVMVGSSSGRQNNTGAQNVFMGSGAGSDNESGSKNVYIGRNAGVKLEGSGNVIIGAEAGPRDIEEPLKLLMDNRLYIDNMTNPDPLIYGEFDSNLLRINGRLEATKNITVGLSMKLTPTSSVPSCRTIDDAGTIYYDLSDHTIKACTGTIGAFGSVMYSWKPLH